MKSGWLCGVALLLPALGGCVTTTERVPAEFRTKADMSEAARLNTQLGVAYAREGEYDVALEKLQRALEQNPDYAPAHSAMAVVFVQRNEPDKAEVHYRTALKLSPDDPDTLNNFGIFLCRRDKADEAQELFLRAARNPGYREPEKAYTNAGVCARRADQDAAAEDFFRQALKVRPNYAEALQQMASLSLQREDFLRARAFLQRYEKVAPPTPQTLWMGAKIESALGDGSAADDYRRRLKSEFPESEESANLVLGPAS